MRFYTIGRRVGLKPDEIALCSELTTYKFEQHVKPNFTVEESCPHNSMMPIALRSSDQ
jgi:hypothetical protein